MNTQGHINSVMRDFLHTDIDGFDSLAELAAYAMVMESSC
jgi:hypothetical protein